MTKVLQDGAQFYNDEDGQFLWEAPFKVTDHDLAAAQRARVQFQDWARETGLTVEFEGLENSYFKVWLINFGYWATGAWETLDEATEAAKGFGFECSVQEYVPETKAFVQRASVSPIGGVRIG